MTRNSHSFCINCGKDFIKKSSGKQVYCSIKCASAKLVKNETRKCKRCGKEFIVSPSSDHKYCSRECIFAPKVKLICVQCGKEFERTESNLKLYKIHFCGTDCQYAHKSSSLVKLVCEICNKQFTVSSFLAKNGRKYCSHKCKNKAIDTRIPKECPVCLKTFLAKPCNIERGKDTYCSDECRLKGNERTTIEIEISRILSELKIEFVEQYRVGRYTCDHFAPLYNLIIEEDGSYWHSLEKVKQCDKRKNEFILSKGYKLLRIPEQTIRTDRLLCKHLIIEATKSQAEQNNDIAGAQAEALYHQNQDYLVQMSFRF